MKPLSHYILKSILLILLSWMAADCVTSQKEIELRTDGIVVPRVDSSTVSSPSTGQVIYDTNTSKLRYYNGSSWRSVGGAFERDGTLIRLKDGFDTDDFILGQKEIPSPNDLGGVAMFFIRSKGAFRGGVQIPSLNYWHPDSIKIGSFAYGYNVNASGSEGSTAIGYNTKASGDYGSTALGDFTKASGRYGAIAIGSSTLASGDNGATAIGYNTEASGDNCLAVGRWNRPIVTAGQDIIPTSPLFIVGNGDNSGNRSNAMVVRKDGKVGIGENTPAGFLHIKADNILNDPQLKITGDGGDAFMRIEMNRASIANKSWFQSAKIDATDDSVSLFSIVYEESNNSFAGALRINGKGNTGLGTLPNANRLAVSGNASKTVAGDWLANSDRRIKTDITEIENSYALLENLRPVKFKYSEEWKEKNPSVKDQFYYNFIAQEYQEVFPESVQGSGEYLENDDQEILQIDTYNAQIATIAAVKELIKENARLKEAIEDQNNHFQSQIDELKGMLSERNGNE